MQRKKKVIKWRESINEMLPSNSLPQHSGNAMDEEAEEVEDQGEQGPLNLLSKAWMNSQRLKLQT